MTWQRPHRHMPCHLSTYGTENKECTSPEMALWRLSDHFSYPCEYAIRFDLSFSFCEYSNNFHCLHCSPSCFDPDSLLLAYLWLGLSWIDCISATKTFSSSQTSSRKPYNSSKQQERHKQSVEITIKLSQPGIGSSGAAKGGGYGSGDQRRGAHEQGQGPDEEGYDERESGSGRGRSRWKSGQTRGTWTGTTREAAHQDWNIRGRGGPGWERPGLQEEAEAAAARNGKESKYKNRGRGRTRTRRARGGKREEREKNERRMGTWNHATAPGD